jgi:hypothetical protein
MTEQQAFDQAMKKILSVSKAELQRRLEAEKRAKISVSRVPAASR